MSAAQVKPATIVVGILTVPLLAGCGVKQDKPVAKTCQSEIRLDSKPEPLGSSKALSAEFKAAGNKEQSVSFGEVTRAAGWSDNWDTVIDVSSAMDDNWLNKMAETPPGTCWKGLPPRIGSDPASFGYYVFLKDRQVVQSVTWDTGYRVLEFRANERLTHETMLNAKSGGLRTY
ncbi:hypothetical protein ACFXO9_08680 [Nocardia tengchongensis]|uniref:hypothetical protein n=1 Tax=Nocardia tengchongensis TaxID=2055889 RepID=UPI0036756CE3